jgi:hypothetical protein
VYHAQRQVEPALLPAGVIAGAVGESAKLQRVDQLSSAGVCGGFAHAVQPGLKHQVLTRGRATIHSASLADIADLLAYTRRLAQQITTCYRRRAAARLEQGRQHTQRRSLAGAIWAKKAK